MKYVAAVLLLFAVACGGGDQSEGPPAAPGSSTAPDASTSTVSGETTTTVAGDVSTITDGTTPTTSDRMPAPDFTLELGEGGSYTLSEGAKPVYLVFWAEW